VPKNAAPAPAAATIPSVPIEEMAVAELVGQKAAWNPRRISSHDADQLEKSLRDFGCVQPIVWNRRTKTVLGGHQRLAVLARYGVERTPVSVVDLDPDRERVLNVVLNRTGGEFDDDKLRELVEGLASSAPELLDGLGFTQDELRALEAGAGGLDELEKRATSTAAPPARARVEEDPPAPPEDPSATKAAVTRAGDSWTCGDHVVHCLDSTLPESLERLAKGPPADCVVTDPPYAIYGSSSGLAADVTDDRIVRPFFARMVAAVEVLLRLGGHAYVFCDWRSWPAIWEVTRGTKLFARNLLVWDKGSSGLGNNYANTHELIGFFSTHKRKRRMIDNAAQANRRDVLRPNVLHFNRVPAAEREHNAAKPVALVAELITNSTDEGDRVLDLFGGSGTALVACEKTKRRAVAVDVAPACCDVMVRRWQRMTGRPARRQDGVEFNAAELEPS
jgi:DNA modification methylase